MAESKDDNRYEKYYLYYDQRQAIYSGYCIYYTRTKGRVKVTDASKELHQECDIKPFLYDDCYFVKRESYGTLFPPMMVNPIRWMNLSTGSM